MTQLAAHVDDVETLWTVDAIPDPEFGFYTVGSEIVQVIAGFPGGDPGYAVGQTFPSKIRVIRATNGTSAATHAQGVALTAANAFSGGGGAMTVTGVQGGSVASATTLSTPGTVRENPAGTAQVGGSVTVSADDPGAIGPGNLWLQVVFGNGSDDGGYGRLWVRNSGDDGWNSGAPMAYGDATTTFVASPNDVGELVLSDALGSRLTDPNSAMVQGGGTSLFMDALGVHIGPGGPVLLTGSADPSAGGGVAAPISSLYLKADGTLWQKTGAGDTAWSAVGFFNTSLANYTAANVILLKSATDNDLDLVAQGTGTLALSGGNAVQVSGGGFYINGNGPIAQAAFVANGSTVDQLRDALIASGLMAAS